MTKRIRELYRRFRDAGSGIIGFDAKASLRSARTLARWERLEDLGYVRLIAEPDDLPSDWFADPRDNEILAREGAWVSIGQFRLDPTRDKWECADSVGGHVGYRDVLDPFENCYIVGIMDETLEALDHARAIKRRERLDRAAGRCVYCHGTGRLTA